ncbi:hypothetical protein HYV31_03590 [candidate division WWE3 bacterium]|nr:hypothetical protein [candidate division WWE3 bacterium]
MNTKTINVRLIFGVVLILILSWVLLHFLAILGIFFAITYPIWWLLLPNATVCFSCRGKRDGDWCSLCKRSVNKNNFAAPASIKSAILNGVIILIFTFISAGVVFLESQLFFKLGIPPTPKTVSIVIPPKGQYRLGEIFPMKVEISNVQTPINTVQTDISFDPAKLEVVDISTADSFANIFIQKEINNEIGYARLTGGLPNPGFSSDGGLFGTVYFKGKTPGIVKVSFLPSSMVLANDSRGTDVLKDFASVSYLVLPEKISESEDNQQKQLRINGGVMGAQSTRGQLIFFEDGDRVLGSYTEIELDEVKKINIMQEFLIMLEKIDRFIIGLYINQEI